MEARSKITLRFSTHCEAGNWMIDWITHIDRPRSDGLVARDTRRAEHRADRPYHLRRPSLRLTFVSKLSNFVWHSKENTR